MDKKEEKIKKIDVIGNYYGGLYVKEVGQNFYWSIENYDGHHWRLIPEYLYRALLKFEHSMGGASTEYAQYLALKAKYEPDKSQLY